MIIDMQFTKLIPIIFIALILMQIIFCARRLGALTFYLNTFVVKLPESYLNYAVILKLLLTLLKHFL